MTITTRLSNDKKVYGTTTMTPDSKDDEVMMAYSGISEVITLRTVGLNGSGSTVKMGPEYASYHIYNKDLAYLGTGRDKLEHSDKYYMSTQKQDIEFKEPNVTETTKPVPADDISEPVTPSPAEQSLTNANHNPATGR